jgi:hypothetical protein
MSGVEAKVSRFFAARKAAPGPSRKPTLAADGARCLRSTCRRSVGPNPPLVTRCCRRRSKLFALRDASFDHLVGTQQDRLRHRYPERLGGLGVDHKFEFGLPAQAPRLCRPTGVLLSAYFADAGNTGSLPTSRASCWMMTVALRLAAIFLKRSSEPSVWAWSVLNTGTPLVS